MSLRNIFHEHQVEERIPGQAFKQTKRVVHRFSALARLPAHDHVGSSVAARFVKRIGDTMRKRMDLPIGPSAVRRYS
jgi:hypothetical protein